MKHTKKLLFITLFATNIFLTARYASADDLADMSPTDAMDEIIDDLDIDKNELKYAIKTFNVSRKKKQPPLVSLVFDPANPAPGEKITVIANPSYFNNDSKDLYFTWFLKPSGCPNEKDDSPSDSTRDKCDFDGNGIIDIQDYKVKAMRLIAGNDFDWDKDGDEKPDSATYATSRDDDDGYSAIWGGDDQKGKNYFCYIHDIELGDEYKIDCNKHLFPDVSEGKVGNGSFTLDEEKFWHTDPHDPDTADTGYGDEANVAGLGAVSFSWTYEQGDEVGVAVEGVSNEATQEEDSSYRTMWALSKNTCGLGDTNADYPDTDLAKGETTPIGDPVTGYSTVFTETKKEILHQISYWAEIQTTVTTYIRTTDLNGNQLSYTRQGDPVVTDSFVNIADDIKDEMRISKASDIDKCLYKNLVDPYEGGGEASKLTVSLSYLPDDPMNDPVAGSDEGDELVIQSSIANSYNASYLNYEWQVYQADTANPESWGAPLLKQDLKNSTQTKGMGLSTFRFKLNFPNPKKYLKVKLTVKENAGNNAVREGHSSVVIPISSTSERIRTYGTIVSRSGENLSLSLDSEERCTQGMDKIICPVVKNEIVGVKIDGLAADAFDFLWTINGKPASYKECFFDGCQIEKQGSTMFFPVLESVGFDYDISLLATDQESGNKVSVSRTFRVSNPEIKIASADETTCQPLLLGHYVDLDGKLWPDYSKNSFIAVAEQTIKLRATATPPSMAYNWYVDGNLINQNTAKSYGYDFDRDGNLILSGKIFGESYQVIADGAYSQDVLTKKALNKFWDVPLKDFYEKQNSVTINIKVAGSLEDNLASAPGKNKILASVYSAVPAYLVFLIRIVLLAFLMIFTSRFILFYLPRVQTDARK